jgi:hypothetical protein
MAHQGVGPIRFETVSQVTQTPSVELGTRVINSGEEYVYCYNATGSAVTQGALMIASGAVSGYSLTRSSVASVDLPMVAVKNAALAAGDYFWGLVRGQCRVMSIAITAGNLVGVGTDGAINTFLVGSFPTGVVVGKALDTATASTMPLIQLRLYG